MHEAWVYRRIAAVDTLVKHGVTDLAIEHVGKFEQRVAVKLGRHNVLFGLNDTGKSTLCECLAAFSGGRNFDACARRFRLFGAGPATAVVRPAWPIAGR